MNQANEPPFNPFNALPTSIVLTTGAALLSILEGWGALRERPTWSSEGRVGKGDSSSVMKTYYSKLIDDVGNDEITAYLSGQQEVSG